MFLAVWDHQQGVWGNVGPGHSPSLHSCMLLHHLTTRVGCDLFPGPDVIWMIKTLRKALGGKSSGVQRAAASNRSACGSLCIAEMWCDTWNPFTEHFQHRFAHSITQRRMMTCPALKPLQNWGVGKFARCFKTSQGTVSTCHWSLVRLKCLFRTFGNLAP